MIRRLFQRFWYEGIWLRLFVAGFVLLILQITPVPQVPLDALRSAVALSGEGRHEEAAKELGIVYAYQPWSADRLSFRIREDLLGFDVGGAQRDLERLAALRPLTTTETVTLVAIHIRQGDMSTAEQLWRTEIAANTVNPDDLAQMAQGSISHQDWPAASAALLGLMVAHPDDPAPVYRLGLVQALDQPQYALGTLTKASTMDSQLGKTATLVEENVATRIVESPEKVYAQLGTIYISLSEFEMAESALSRAHDINPAYADALAYLAYARAKLGRPALGAIHEALGLSPNNPVIHYLAGLTLKQIGRLDDARAEFEDAYDLDPKNPAYAVEIASIHRAQHAEQYAEVWLNEAVRLAPNEIRFKLLLAEFYADDNYQLQGTGLPLAEKLVADYPDNAEAHAVLGWAAYRLGDANRALGELNTAITLDPSLARAQLHLGFVNEALGNRDEAIAHYQRASALDPQGSFGALARRALKRLGIG